MTTGRINQIANVIPPTHAEEEASLSILAGRKEARRRDAALHRVLYYYSRLQSLAGGGIPFRGGNRDAIACEGSEHLAAVARGRDVFPLLTHRPSITRTDSGRRRCPSVGARRRLPTVVPERAYVRSSSRTTREGGAPSRDQWFAR